MRTAGSCGLRGDTAACVVRSLVLALGWFVPTQAGAQAQFKTVYPGEEADLGHGYYSERGESSAFVCVRISRADLKPATGTTIADTYVIDMASTRSLTDELALSVGFAYNALFSNASLEAKYERDHVSSASNRTTRVVYRVQLTPLVMSTGTPALTDTVKAWLQKLPAAARRASFRQRCGDKFVAGLIREGRLSATLSVAAESFSASDAANLSARVFASGYSGFAKYTTSHQETLSSTRTEYHVSDEGGTGISPKPTAVELEAYASGYRAQIETSGGAIVGVALGAYESIPGFADSLVVTRGSAEYDQLLRRADSVQRTFNEAVRRGREYPEWLVTAHGQLDAAKDSLQRVADAIHQAWEASGTDTTFTLTTVLGMSISVLPPKLPAYLADFGNTALNSATVRATQERFRADFGISSYPHAVDLVSASGNVDRWWGARLISGLMQDLGADPRTVPSSEAERGFGALVDLATMPIAERENTWHPYQFQEYGIDGARAMLARAQCAPAPLLTRYAKLLDVAYNRSNHAPPDQRREVEAAREQLVKSPTPSCVRWTWKE